MDTSTYLRRHVYSDIATIGDYYWGNDFFSNILETNCRNRDLDNNGRLTPNEKVQNKTAIPSGRYEIKMQWSNHFQRDMPHLQAVPMFTDVMIHWGNSAKDTEGCLIVGNYDAKNPDWVSNSQATYKLLEPKILSALSSGKLFISISGGYTA